MNYNENFSLEPIKYFCEIDQVWKVEEFRYLKNFIGCYEVSDLGRVKSLKKKPKILKNNNASFGYKNVCLSKNNNRKTYTVHVLVAIAFLNHNPGGYNFVVNHKNYNPSDNRVSNLEIVTQRENANLKRFKHSSSYVGVCWNILHKKWQSRIIINKKRIHLGYYFDEYEAHLAYQNALSNIK